MKKGKGSLQVFVVVCLFSALIITRMAVPIKASQDVIYVPTDYPTIQEAINNANHGDTIFVYSGFYYENVVVNKTVTLIGENRTTTIIDGNFTGKVIEVTANNARITDFTVRNSGGYPDSGINVPSSGNDISHNIIKSNHYGVSSSGNNTISGNDVRHNHFGIRLSGSNSLIENNTVQDSHCGMFIEGSSNTISHNNVSGCNYGIMLFDGRAHDSVVIKNTIMSCSTGIDSSNNLRARIIGNMLANNSYGARSTGDKSNSFINNTFLTNDVGLYLSRTYYETLRGNNFSGNMHNLKIYVSVSWTQFWKDIDTSNTINGKKIYYLNNQRDLVIDSDSFPDIGYLAIVNYKHITPLNITIRNLTLANMDQGVLLGHVSGVRIENCSIVNNLCGLRITHTMSAGNLIHHNNFINNIQQVSRDPWSSAQNTWDDGVYGNYWSDYEDRYPNATEIDGSGIWDTPYIIDENNQDNYPLTKPWSSLPVINIDTGLGYPTIQQAINAPETLDGHTIFVYSGTYYENVIVNKTIALIGEHTGTTFIYGDGDDTVSISANNVSVSGFTVENSSPRPYGCSIRVDSNYNKVCGNLVTNSSNGIEVWADHNEICDNTVTNCGRGIQAWQPAGNLAYCTFSRNNISCSSEGIYFVNLPQNCEISNNNLTLNSRGIYVGQSVHGGMRFINNTFHSNNIGLTILSSERLCLRGNNFTNNRYNLEIKNIIFDWERADRYRHDIDETNRINGKPIVYKFGVYDPPCDLLIDPTTYPKGVGYLAIIAYFGDLSHLMAHNITVRDLDLFDNGQALLFYGVRDSVVESCNIANNLRGVQLIKCHDNNFSHNNFINNQLHASMHSGVETNFWDAGYPSGGNYWSDYTGVDKYSAPNQDELSSDGIGDTPYVIDANNRDRYPLMVPWRNTPYYDWPMFRHDLRHTGYSSSKAPNANKTLWIHQTEGAVLSSPAVVDGMVFIGSYDGKLYALNMTTGALVWNYTTGLAFVLSSPTVSNGKVFGGAWDWEAGRVYCLNETSGELIWSFTPGGMVRSSPAVAHGIVYVGSGDGKVYALNETTGTLIWNYTTGAYVHSSPAIDGDTVFLGSGDGKVYALNASSGTLIWNRTTGYISFSSPAVTDSRVFIHSEGDHGIYCLNKTNGAAMWIYHTEEEIGPHYPSAAVFDGFVFIGTRDGKVLCLNETSGNLIWWYQTGGVIESSPAVADGKVFIGSADGKFYCLNETTGNTVWSYDTGSEVFSSPAVAGGIVFVGAHNGKIYAFGRVHDVSITNIMPSKIVVGQGYNVFINVTVENQGDYAENFNVTTYANTTVIATLTDITLASETSTTVTFTWNTTGVAVGNYTISANATILPGETDTADNTYTDGIVTVTIPGDVNGDFRVGYKDLFALAVAYGSEPGDRNWNPNCDFDGDKRVGYKDLFILAANYGKKR